MHEDLGRLLEKGILWELDCHFGQFIGRFDPSGDFDLILAAALVSHYTRLGHVCLDLHAVAGKTLLEEDGGHAVCCPGLKRWTEKLSRSNAVGSARDYRPLILDKGLRLYLHRYWQYQRCLVHHIRARMVSFEESIDMKCLQSGLKRLFGHDNARAVKQAEKEIDWQQVAAFTALYKRFCLISGGPGTGKTTTVAKIMTLILEQPHLSRSRIALAAPTGKAAARLQEALRQAKTELKSDSGVKKAIPDEASTIHRLLGTIPGSAHFRYHRNNRLPVDTLVVDEASMVDLALMSKLVQALPDHSRLILLGDKDQLSSVEAGAVFGDLSAADDMRVFSETFIEQAQCATGFRIPVADVGSQDSGLQDCMVPLEKNYRFGPYSDIAFLSQRVNAGDGEAVYSFLVSRKSECVHWRPLPRPEMRRAAMGERILQGFSQYLQAKEIADAFRLFDRFRIFCAVREGPYGVNGMNRLVEGVLQNAALVDPELRWYHGRPVIIASNDYHLQLFNGDVGLLWRDPDANNDLRAFFHGTGGSFRRFHPLRLPAHETVYAMTVHKSQGSEFDDVVLILPDRVLPVVTRELLYTGLTRARKHVEIWGLEDVLKGAVSNRTERMSGLWDMLRGASEP